jgi:hypothetical protein
MATITIRILEKEELMCKQKEGSITLHGWKYLDNDAKKLVLKELISTMPKNPEVQLPSQQQKNSIW